MWSWRAAASAPADIGGNMRIKRKIGAFGSLLLAALLLLAAPVSGWAAGGRADRAAVDYRDAEGWPEGPEISSQAACLIDLKSGAILYEKNGDETLYPASITKVLTALLIVENCDLDETLTFSRQAVEDIEADGRSGLVAEGDQMTVRDCLYLLLLKSSNEAAYALAEHMSGSVEAFAEEMNRRAEELGAENSHFANPHGLFDENHYTTARDMARIYWGAVQNETFLEINSTPRYSMAPTATWPDGFTVEMLDQMLVPGSEYYNEDVAGGKTGYIQKAQNTLVTYGVREERELVCVTMKAEARSQSYEDTEALLDYGFESFTLYPAAEQVDQEALMAEAAAEAPGVEALEVDPDAWILLPLEVSVEQAEAELQMDEPAEGGAWAGRLVYTWQGREIASVPVSAQVAEAESSASGAGDPAGEAGGLEDFRAQSQQEEENFLAGLAPWQLAVLAAGALAALALIVLFILRLWIQHQRRKRRRMRRQNRERYRK